MVIGLIDILVIIICVMSILFAIYRGLICELMGISSWIIAAVGALYGYTYLNQLIAPLFASEKISVIISGLVIALFIVVVFSLLNARISARLRQSALSKFDRSLGFIFGIIRAVLLICLVYVVCTLMMSKKQISEINKTNFTVPYIEKTVDYFNQFVPDNIKQSMNAVSNTKPAQPKIESITKQQEKPAKKPQKVEKPVKKQVKTAKPIDETHVYEENERNSLDNIMQQLDKETHD